MAGNDWFVVKPNFADKERLERSLGQGIFYPAIVGRHLGEKYLVDGSLRLRCAGERMRIEELDFPDLESLFAAIVSVNASFRELHVVEKAFLIRFAAERKLRIDLSCLLQTKIDGVVAADSAKIAALPEFYLSLLQTYKPSFKQIQALLPFDRPELAEIERILLSCRFSQSNFFGFLEDLRHCSAVQGLSISEIAANPEFSGILAEKASPCEKGEALRRLLFRRLKPDYSACLAELDRLKRQLRANRLELVYNPNLEDDAFQVAADVSNPEEIETLCERLRGQMDKLREAWRLIRDGCQTPTPLDR